MRKRRASTRTFGVVVPVMGNHPPRTRERRPPSRYADNTFRWLLAQAVAMVDAVLTVAPLLTAKAWLGENCFQGAEQERPTVGNPPTLATRCSRQGGGGF
jgi:ribosome biogenesis SPOUT family RNA methylase Rps3